MSLIHQHILEFNKLVSSINFLSSTNDVAIKNKLFLIQQNITEDVDFNSFESYNFISNIYNILTQTSDNKSPVVTNCIDLLHTSINSRNKSVIKIIQDINFLPAITKVLWSGNDCNDSLIKLLTLIKNIIKFNYDLDEHNLKVFIGSLRDYFMDSNDKRVIRLSMSILVNLSMHNHTAKYLIRKNIQLSDLDNRLDTIKDLISMKFYIIVLEQFIPKDIFNIIKLSLNSIKDALPLFDSEPIIHSIDIFKIAKKLCNGNVNFSDMENLLGIFEELNNKLVIHFGNDTFNELKKEFIENIFDFYGQLLDFDNNLVEHFAKFITKIFEHPRYTRSACGLKFLSNFIHFGGSFEEMDKTVESIIEYFNNNCDVSPKVIGNNEKYEFLKFLKVLHQNGKLDSIHFKTVLDYMENILSIFDSMLTEHIDEDAILLLVYSLQTLHVLSQDSSLFKDFLDKLFDLNIIPYVITKAYMLKNENVLMILFSLTSMERFPNAKIAMLLSQNVYSCHDQVVAYQEVKNKSESKFTSKYIMGHLQDDLDSLIKRINQKLDNNDYNGLKSSDVISLYRQKINYLQENLTTVSNSLTTYADLYNKAQQQNCILRRLGDKQEVVNWSLMLDMENVTKVNRNLESEISHLGQTIASFRSKVEKESSQIIQLSKQITIKNKEIEKFRSEKAAMESEKQKFRQAQKENEIRIQQLKQSLEEEKKSRESEVSSAVAEQKRVIQNAEKEQAKLQEVIKLNENDIMQKQKRISELETELKEAEKIQTSILSLMQKSKRT